MAIISREVRRIFCTVTKTDSERRLVFGFGMACTVDGNEYWDLQKDHIPEDVMLDSVLDFMRNCRVSKDQHGNAIAGEIVFGFPLTTTVAKAMGITTAKTGFMVGLRATPEVFKRFESGQLRGFSIAGMAEIEEEVEEAA